MTAFFWIDIKWVQPMLPHTLVNPHYRWSLLLILIISRQTVGGKSVAANCRRQTVHGKLSAANCPAANWSRQTSRGKLSAVNWSRQIVVLPVFFNSYYWIKVLEFMEYCIVYVHRPPSKRHICRWTNFTIIRTIDVCTLRCARSRRLCHTPLRT
jgi:hypothetical protein